MPVFVRASQRAKAYTRRGNPKKSRSERIASIRMRYERASAQMLRLPGPSSGAYGVGHKALDRAYSRASSVMRRVHKMKGFFAKGGLEGYYK